MKVLVSILIFCFIINGHSNAQYRDYKISIRGDTINRVDNNGLKQGPWVIHVDPLRGAPGYEEEGYYKNDLKNGTWRKYTLQGDFVAYETFKDGEKDGKSQYFTPYGGLVREESWHAYDPAHPYDTIPIYGEKDNQIIEYRIVKAEPHSVKDGTWTWYNPETGRIIRIDQYFRGVLKKKQLADDQLPQSADLSHLPGQYPESATANQDKKVPKPKEVIEFEKKNSKKKKVKVIDGRTGY